MRRLRIDRYGALILVSLAVAVYLVWWSTYAQVHFVSRYTQLDPGRAAQARGASVRVLSMTVADGLTAGSAEPTWPTPGSQWVVAELEVTRLDPARPFYCETAVLGPEGREWTAGFATGGRERPRCDSDALVVGRPARFEAVYEIPARYVDQVLGIVVPDSSTAERVPVLTPPR